MDKNTRLLLLYSKLIQGGKVNKTVFCMEVDCLPRSFDRDIEDIRLFLSESFSADDLIYDRLQNAYYISGLQRVNLEVMEYLFIERILLDTGILRQDELDILVSHLLSITENSNRIIIHSKELVEHYVEPLHNKALLKMYGDLEATIRNKSVIKLNYTKMDGNEVERTVIPCAVKYDLGYIYLIAFREKKEDSYPAYFRMDRIESFTILRSQLWAEQKRVSEYIKYYARGITQMYGGDFSEIMISGV
nr:WYL domain-containing protein [uncultured Anaerosporobacter sp.]